MKKHVVFFFIFMIIAAMILVSCDSLPPNDSVKDTDNSETAAPGTDANPSTDTMPETDAVTETNPNSETDANSETYTESETNADPETDVNPETYTEPETNEEPETETEPATDTTEPVIDDPEPVTTVGLVVEDVSADKGESITVSVSIKNNPGFLTLAAIIEYDESVMTLTKVENGSNFSDYTFLGPRNKESGCKAAWYSPDLPETVEDGDVLILTFKILDAAASGTYDVKVYNPNDGGTVDANKIPFTVSAATGHITVN